MRIRGALFALLLATVGTGAVFAGPALVVAWPSNMLDDPRGAYPVRLLQLAADRSASRYRVEASRVPMNQSRALLNLERSNGIDVAWTFTSRERERVLLPIRIPVDRGLLGWRLLLMRGSAPALEREEALRTLRMVQGADWPDLVVLHGNGFQSLAGSSYPGLFQMLHLGRADAFPRSVSEVFAELERPDTKGLQLESDWVLHYPAPVYFFVSRRRPELAIELERGLRLAMADGSALALFEQSFGEAIRRARLGQRKRIELVNPDLHPATPLTDAGLWFDPEHGR